MKRPNADRDDEDGDGQINVDAAEVTNDCEVGETVSVAVTSSRSQNWPSGAFYHIPPDKGQRYYVCPGTLFQEGHRRQIIVSRPKSAFHFVEPLFLRQSRQRGGSCRRAKTTLSVTCLIEDKPKKILMMGMECLT